MEYVAKIPGVEREGRPQLVLDRIFKKVRPNCWLVLKEKDVLKLAGSVNFEYVVQMIRRTRGNGVGKRVRANASRRYHVAVRGWKTPQATMYLRKR